MLEYDFKALRKPRKDYNSRGRYAAGGKVEEHKEHEDEAEDKKLIKKEIGKAKIKLRSGGEVMGEKAKQRADKPMKRGKFAKGGHVGHKPSTKVNVIVAGKDGAPSAPPMAPAMAPPMARPMPPMPQKPPMPPMGAGPQAPMKKGGRVKRAEGGRMMKFGEAERIHDFKHHIKPKVHMANVKMKRGGEVKMKRGGSCK